YVKGTADAAAPTVQPELRFTRGKPEKLIRGEHGILHEVIDLAVHAVCAGLQAHVDGCPSHKAGAGVEGSALNLKLLHNPGRRRVSNLRPLHVGRAIHHELIASGARAVN